MTLPLLCFFAGLLPGIFAALIATRRANGEVALLRERLAAEEACKRHFMEQANRHEGAVALLTQELHRLEVEIARHQLPPSGITV